MRLLKTKIAGILLAVMLVALLVLPVMAANEFEVKGANVYSGYLETDDWLIVVRYQNMLEPYYGNDTAGNAFLLRLATVDGTIVAQTPLPSWGYRPGSIYLSATTAASLEWGLNYTISIYGQDANHNTTNYTLVAGDWRGSNLVILDDWCLALATSMETYDNATYTAMTTEKGLVLDEEGGVLFDIGIPALSSVRPNLFQVVVSDIPHEEDTATWAFWSTLPSWDEAVGPELASILNSTGGLINVGGDTVGMMFIFILWAAIATTAFAVGHGTAGMALSLPILALGTYYQFIPFAVMGVAIAVVVVLVIREIWWSKT